MSNHDKAKRLAERVETARTDAGRTTRWLSDNTGIPYPTLRRNIEVTPERFSIDQVEKIADALGVEFETLVANKVAA